MPKRVVTDVLTLPYSWNDVQIKQNELVVADNVTAAIIKLNTNLIYVSGQTQIGNISILNSTILYPISALGVNTEEFVAPFATNKTLYKSLYNHLALRDNFHSRFIAKTQFDGSLLVTNSRYLIPGDGIIFDDPVDLNYFVGVNEIVSTAILNRALKRQFDIGQSFFNFCQLIII